MDYGKIRQIKVSGEEYKDNCKEDKKEINNKIFIFSLLSIVIFYILINFFTGYFFTALVFFLGSLIVLLFEKTYENKYEYDFEKLKRVYILINNVYKYFYIIIIITLLISLILYFNPFSILINVLLILWSLKQLKKIIKEDIIIYYTD
ncbi:L-lactate permease [Methanobrevibacter sp.]|uniref:L-lactate permease n=1 Tax=Methanobrevibacter sp. TaxID=66852 RepID=UPI0026256764|nr:L-lactate permease [uncultured Methanobrevibacter sp.]